MSWIWSCRGWSKETTINRQVDLAWLAAFRLFFGLTMFVSMCRFIVYGWVADLFVTPKIHLKYWGMGWVEPLPAPGMLILFCALALLAVCVAAGFCFRVVAPIFALGLIYLQLVDISNYLNHYYLAALLASLIAVSPAHRCWSLDVRWGLVSRAETAPVAWLWIFRLQIGLVYSFAALAKAQPDWLLHGQPLGIWLSSHTGMPIAGHFFAHPSAGLVMSWAGFLFDLTIPWLLLARKTRPFAFGLVIVFHLFTRALFPIGMFPAIMIVSALVFFSPSWPRRWLREPMSFAAPSSSAKKFGKIGISLAAIYCALQLVLPLRSWFYQGDVLWHEQGMRFSWRVMVREKNGSLQFTATERESGRVHHLTPGKYLTRVQEREMSGQPDLILQLAHIIRDDFMRRGSGPVEVRVDALVSLNGRRAQYLIDPSIDLAAIDAGIEPAHWILPAPLGPPPTLRPVASR